MELYDEDDLLPLSGLAHMAYCERRWALVHVEQQWEDNRYTVEGTQGHERAHSGELESRPGLLIRRALPLRSLRLGLSGQSDVVEFTPAKEGGCVLRGQSGRWQPLPVEFKRSRDKAGSIAYRLQLCAQAMCLEEMLGVSVERGAIFDVGAKRREEIPLTAPVRSEVERLALRMQTMHRSGRTPPAIRKPACRKCSMATVCLPDTLEEASASDGTVARYLEDALKRAGA